MITGNTVKEISLVYDLSQLFKLDKEKAQFMKNIQSNQKALQYLSGLPKQSSSCY